jgi:hypothetical protein
LHYTKEWTHCSCQNKKPPDISAGWQSLNNPTQNLHGIAHSINEQKFTQGYNSIAPVRERSKGDIKHLILIFS